MKTDELIRALAEDAGTPRKSMPLRLGVALGLGGIVAVVLFAATLGLRPDLAAVAGAWRFQFKLATPIVSFLAAFWACLRLARPDGRPRDVLPALLVGPVLALAGAGAELALTPAASWLTRALGRYSGVCLVAIPSLSAVSLVAALAVLRAGAPRSPALAGAAAGLLAATLSAGIYATHCPDDSPLFFGLWYTTAIGTVVLAGGLAGGRALRW
ncbi:MAG: NrsF family protein [Hyphomicrobiaceae bacterium]|nr:NrsF family protein [Hyphomicrobiaceae bacterium]